MQDNLTPVPISAIEAQINAACGGRWQDRYQSIDPDAGQAVGQVGDDAGENAALDHFG
jgi:predicted unusual protein kinase regulating ubiquinone biosynthesis (AarF/ABC1/UbiB family)